MRRPQRALKPRHLSLRKNVAFTAENDHNPLVLEDCTRCRGYGKYDTYAESGSGDRSTSLHRCEVCSGSGHSDTYARYFDNDAPPVAVQVRANGSLACPCCGWNFTVGDRAVWTGWRHARCGQRIRLIGCQHATEHPLT